METLREEDNKILEPVFFDYNSFAEVVTQEFEDFVGKPPYCSSPEKYPSPQGVFLYGGNQIMLNQALEVVSSRFDNDYLTFNVLPEIPKAIIEYNDENPRQPFLLLNLGEFMEQYSTVLEYFQVSLNMVLKEFSDLELPNEKANIKVKDYSDFLRACNKPLHWVLFTDFDSPLELHTKGFYERGIALACSDIIIKDSYLQEDIPRISGDLTKILFMKYGSTCRKKFNGKL